MQSVVKLRDMRSGQSGVVTDLGVANGERFRLMEMGLLPGTLVRFVRRAPLGGPIEVEIRGFHLSLRAQEAEGILVQVS